MAPSPSAMSAATSWVNVEQCWVSRSSYSTFGCTIFLLCWGLEDVVVGQSRACQPSMNPANRASISTAAFADADKCEVQSSAGILRCGETSDKAPAHWAPWEGCLLRNMGGHVYSYINRGWGGGAGGCLLLGVCTRAATPWGTSGSLQCLKGCGNTHGCKGLPLTHLALLFHWFGSCCVQV